MTPVPDAQGDTARGLHCHRCHQPSPGWWDHGHPRLSTHHTTRGQGTQGGDQDPSWHPGGTKEPKWGLGLPAPMAQHPVLPSEPPQRGRMRPPSSTPRCHSPSQKPPSCQSLSQQCWGQQQQPGDNKDTPPGPPSLPNVVGPQGNLQLPEHLRRLLHSPLELEDGESCWHHPHA